MTTGLQIFNQLFVLCTVALKDALLPLQYFDVFLFESYCETNDFLLLMLCGHLLKKIVYENHAPPPPSLRRRFDLNVCMCV